LPAATFGWQGLKIPEEIAMRIHAIGALLLACVPAVAFADVQKAGPPVVTAVTQAEISNPAFSCQFLFTADIKNTGKVAGDFSPTFVVTHQGACTKWKEGCTKDTENKTTFCVNSCVAFGPDTSKTHNHAAMSIPPGATKKLSIQLAPLNVKKADLTVLEKGRSNPVEKSIPAFSAGGQCIH
jgi:hypothetical protein